MSLWADMHDNPGPIPSSSNGAIMQELLPISFPSNICFSDGRDKVKVLPDVL